MKRTAFAILLTLLLAVHVHSAEGRSSMPVKQWLANTSRILAAASLNSPFTEAERRWEALDQCVPDRPVEIRAIIKSVYWQDGVAKVTIERPLGWPARSNLTAPNVYYTSRYSVHCTAEQATRMKGSWFICEGTWILLRDISDVLKEPKTRRVIATVSVGNSKTGYFVSDDLAIQIRGEKFELSPRSAF